MKSRLKAISANHNLSYYTDEKNIPNQQLVTETIEYFNSGAGARAFKPLEFLNLLEKQFTFVKNNTKERQLVVTNLKSLPLDDLEKHILFGVLLKWFGGYPINNLDDDCDALLKEIQAEFLSYPETTPEKEFCRANINTQRKFMKYGIVLTNAIRNNIDANILFDAIENDEPQDNTFDTFDDLFDKALLMESIPAPANNGHKEATKSYHNFFFNVWLQENKGWEYGNRFQYKQLLTKDNWIEYLQNEEQLKAQRLQDFEQKKQSWQVKPLDNGDTHNVIKLIMDRTQLYDFLSVPALDVLHKNAFWHNEQDLPIDCNIYHPKYGYPGFETDNDDVIVTSFNPVTIYRDDNTKKYIYCRYNLQMLCTADDVRFTNKDGKEVVKVDYLQTHQKRLAETEEDFGQIYTREIESKKLSDTTETRTILCLELTSHIQELIELHKRNSNYKEGRDISLLALAIKFLKYIDILKEKEKYSETSEKKINAPEIRRFCELVNDCNLITKGFDESAEVFCKKVCEKYGLTYRTRVSKYFSLNNKLKSTDKHLQKVIELILPNLPGEAKHIILTYINNEIKLYA